MGGIIVLVLAGIGLFLFAIFGIAVVILPYEDNSLFGFEGGSQNIIESIIQNNESEQAGGCKPEALGHSSFGAYV